MNNPTLVMNLIYGDKYMTIMRADDISMDEYKFNFTSVDMESLACNIIVVNDKKTKIIIPLDFDEIEGFSDILLLISAFVYPDSDVSFQIYSGVTDDLEHIYRVQKLKEEKVKTVSYVR